VFWNDELIGKTKVVAKNRNPTWDDAFFHIRMKPKCPPLHECCLRIEVFDWDRLTQDDALGQVSTCCRSRLQFVNHGVVQCAGF
jgi:Ca2+-dependent lipid-binding protein